MPTIKTTGLAENISVLESLSGDIEGICKMGLYDGAKVVADAIRAACPAGETGDLKASLGIAKFQNKNGNIDTIIGFDGYDKNGVPNQLKARVLESGRSVNGKTVGKHPFIRPAVNKARQQAVSAIGAKIEEKTKEIIQGGK